MGATTAQANQTVLTAIGLTGVIAIAHTIERGKETPDVVKVLIGGFLAATMLTFAAQWAPDLARLIALLALLAEVIFAGPALWKAIAGAATRHAGTVTTLGAIPTIARTSPQPPEVLSA